MLHTKPEKYPRVAVDIVLTNEEGGHLLIQRKYSPLGWALPGGHVDLGETLAEAASRELREETELVCSPVDMMFLGYWDNPRRDPRKHMISMAFWAQHWGGTLRANDDAKEAHFVNAHHLGEDKFRFAFPDHEEMIFAQMLQRGKLYGYGSS